jgi:hypothetical protein
LNGEYLKDIYYHKILPGMSQEQLQSIYHIFPLLPRCTPKSKDTTRYNCIAFAAGDNTKPWDPSSYYWPEDVPRSSILEALIQVFEIEGYGICNNPELEEGFEKIAIWSSGNIWQHAARQGKNGRWLSKLGDFDDVEHDLYDLDSTHPDGYGNIACFMKRPRTKRTKHRNRSSGSST